MAKPVNPADDLPTFCLPDFSLCGPAVDDLGPAFSTAIDWLTSKQWLDQEVSGTSEFKQFPVWTFWYNIPLTVGTCCVPCCMCVTNARTMSKITGRTCESEGLIMCALNCIGCYPCYKASVHHGLRKKYGLKGAPMYDCATACCMGACLMCQEVNELQSMGQLHVPHCNEGGAPAAATSATPAAAAAAPAAAPYTPPAVTTPPEVPVAEKPAATPTEAVVVKADP